MWFTKFKNFFMTFLAKQMITIKSLPFIGVSKPIWYLERKDWKHFSIILSALPLIMINHH